MTQASATASAEPHENDLNKAIEELRGVLHDGQDTPSPAAKAPGAPTEPARPAAASAPQATAAASASSPRPAAVHNPNVIMDIPVDVQIILGSTEMSVSQLMALQKGSTVALDRRIGEPVDVMVNGRKIARGEITVMEDDASRFGIRLTEIVEPGKD